MFLGTTRHILCYIFYFLIIHVVIKHFTDFHLILVNFILNVFTMFLRFLSSFSNFYCFIIIAPHPLYRNPIKFYGLRYRPAECVVLFGWATVGFGLNNRIREMVYCFISFFGNCFVTFQILLITAHIWLHLYK